MIDAYSTDKTLDIIDSWCKKWGCKFTYRKASGGLGKARYLGNELVETPVYLSLDSDVQLTLGWYLYINERLEADKDLIYAGSYVVFGDEYSVVRNAFDFYRRQKNTSPVLCATLIRKDKADFSVMIDIHIGEDTIYNYHLLERGGKYSLSHDVYAVHPSSIARDLKHSYGWGGGAKAIGRNGLVEVIRVVRSMYKGVEASIVMADPVLAVYMPLREAVHLIGFFRGKRLRPHHGIKEELDIIFRNRRIVGAKGL